MCDSLPTVAGDRGLMTVLVSSVVAAFAAGAVTSVLVLLYLDALQGPPAAYGIFVSAAAAGSLVGAVAGAAVVSRMGPVATYVASTGLAGFVLWGSVMVHLVVSGGVVQLAYGCLVMLRGSAILPIVVESVEPASRCRRRACDLRR
jgi:hypothetical protein